MAIPVFKMLTLGLLPSPIKVAWYRAKGARIGKRVKIGFLSVISAKSIEIGDDSKIGLLSFIILRENLKLGKRVSLNSMLAVDTGSVEIDDDTVVMEQVIIGGMLSPRSNLTIGKRVKVFPHTFLNPTQEIIIEDDVGIGGSNYIFTHGSWQNVLDGFPATFGPVHIKRNAWLPWRVFVLPNVTIGESAIIGPGAVVSQSVPDLGVAGGVPAEIRDMKGRHIRNLSTKHKHKLIQGILTEFVEYQCYLGRQCHIVDQAAEGKIEVNLQGKKILYSSLNFDKASPSTDCYISLPEIDKNNRDVMSKQKTIWFDLADKSSVYSSSLAATEIRTFFSRYGIRFDFTEL